MPRQNRPGDWCDRVQETASQCESSLHSAEPLGLQYVFGCGTPQALNHRARCKEYRCPCSECLSAYRRSKVP